MVRNDGELDAAVVAFLADLEALAGAGVVGGYHGTWPGLTAQLDSDLLVTTDCRSVLSEVVAARFGVSPAAVFPGFVRETVGVMRGA